jgi:hypothetical protein
MLNAGMPLNSWQGVGDKLIYAEKGRKNPLLHVDRRGVVNQNSPLVFGGVPEWPKGSDCKSDGSAFGGSNPPPSTKS